MKIARLDHLVLTIRNIEETCQFYFTILGMDVVAFSLGRRALSFGNQKINRHEAGGEYKPHADNPTSGSADLCFISAVPLSAVVDQRKDKLRIIWDQQAGPKRYGAIKTGLLRGKIGTQEIAARVRM